MKNEFHMNNKKFNVWKNQKGYACISVIQESGKSKAFLLHRLVWEQANGRVPHGHELHHIDHDKSNWSLDNLIALDRKTHQEIHRQARSTNIYNKAGNKKDEHEEMKG